MRNLELPASHRKNNFDAIRLFLALAVIFGHSFNLLGRGSREPIFRLSHGITYSGDLAVGGFFFISGFLITRSWLASPSTRLYLRKRALRIFPGYVAAAAFTILIIVPLSAGRWVPIESKLVHWAIQMDVMRSSYAFVNNPVANSPNGSLWTIRYEFYCYLIVAGLGVLGMYSRKWLVLILAIGSMMLAGFAGHIPAVRGDYFVPLLGGLGDWTTLFSFFVAGMTFYQYRQAVPHSPILFGAAVIGLVVLMRSGSPPIYRSFQPILLGYIVLFVALSDRIPLHDVGRYGDFSYGTYLYAFPIQQLTIQCLPHLHPLALFSIAAPISLLFAIASWRLVERPFLVMKRPRTASDPTGIHPRPAAAAQGVA